MIVIILRFFLRDCLRKEGLREIKRLVCILLCFRGWWELNNLRIRSVYIYFIF